MTPADWWTIDEVQAYLGHDKRHSTEVWLSRHGLGAIRHYPAQKIIEERQTARSRAQRPSTEESDAA